MRWPKPQPHEGDTRIVRKFLLLPRKLQGEWRWLESTYIKQERRLRTAMIEGSSGRATCLAWASVAWVDTPVAMAKDTTAA